MSAPAYDVFGSARAAGFWIRLLAYFIDTVITGLGLYLFDIPYALLGHYEAPPAIGIITLSAYWVALPVLLGGTLGKLVLKLRIIDAETGENISWIKSIGRYACWLLVGIPFCLGYIWIGIDEEKRGWHDMLVKTKVVHF